MQSIRPYVLTIGGFDPSGGAGVLADIKTFEQIGVQGMAVNTANTVQNDTEFLKVDWIDEELILEQLDILLKKFEFSYIKIGLIPSFSLLQTVAEKTNQSVSNLILDPIMKTSSGLDFAHNLNELKDSLRLLKLITPNWNEMRLLAEEDDILKSAIDISKLCTVYLKGGHNIDNIGLDYLIKKEKVTELKKMGTDVTEKHGSGCVFSSALTGYLALGDDIETAVIKAKEYVTKFLESNTSLLGYHI